MRTGALLTVYCPGAGMWKRHSRMENGRTWAESQSTPHAHSLTRHSSSAHPLPPSSASLAPASLWRGRTHVHTHVHTHSHVAWLGQPGLLLASPWMGKWSIQVSLYRVWGTPPPLSSTQSPAGILRPPKKRPLRSRQKEHVLLTLLGRFSRPSSGVLLDGSEEERKAGRRDLKHRNEQKIIQPMERGGLCSSPKLSWGAGPRFWLCNGLSVERV